MEEAPCQIKCKTYYFTDIIQTDYQGYSILGDFFDTCQRLGKHATIYVDFKNLKWFDSNLSALWGAILYYLKQNLKQNFYTKDIDIVRNKFDVLLRNGFFKFDGKIIDNRESTIPYKEFDTEDKDGFYSYVENDLLKHRGMSDEIKLKEDISECLMEIFVNTQCHANSQWPFFASGQYYPQAQLLVFTMVDIGEGFLPKVQNCTHGKITSEVDAILWALKGNTTKGLYLPGGLGLRLLNKTCKQYNGSLQILSNNGYWTSVKNRSEIIKKPFKGTTISLFFRKRQF